MTRVLLVGLGGFAGSILRYLASGWAQRLSGSAGFPWGTFPVNVLGCLAIGIGHGLIEGRGLLGPETRAFLLIGLLGGFTTFSTFAWESWALGRDGELSRLLANTGGQILIGLVAVWAGYNLARLGTS